MIIVAVVSCKRQICTNTFSKLLKIAATSAKDILYAYFLQQIKNGNNSDVIRHYIAVESTSINGNITVNLYTNIVYTYINKVI